MGAYYVKAHKGRNRHIDKTPTVGAIKPFSFPVAALAQYFDF